MAWFKVLCVLAVVATQSFAADEPAKPKPNPDIILNVNREGKVLIGTGENVEALSIPLTKKYLRDQIDLDKQQSTPEVWEKGGGRSQIVLRAHQKTSFKDIHDIMAAARQAGYLDVQLRILPKPEPRATVDRPPVLKVVDEELTIQFFCAENEKLGQIIVTQATGNVELKGLKDLFAFLKKRAEETKSAPSLKCEFAEKLQYEIIFQVIGGCKQEGYARISPTLLRE